MKPGTRLLASIAAGLMAVLLMGGFALSLARSYSAQRNKAISQYGGTVVDVIVAKENIKKDATITSDMYEKRKWVADLLPAGAITSADQLKGARPNTLLLAGEPITKARLAGSVAVGGEVPAGLVALSIPTQPVLAVGGAVRGGNRVSLIVADGKNDPYRLADGILVIATSADGGGAGGATGGVFSGGDASASLTWVTLAVKPELVLPLVNVSESARIHLVIQGVSASTTSTQTGP